MIDMSKVFKDFDLKENNPFLVGPVKESKSNPFSIFTSMNEKAAPPPCEVLEEKSPN